MCEVKPLAIDLIEVRASVQPRETLNEDAIGDYAEHYANGECPLPPCRVFHDGNGHYILSRGFHRHTAAVRAKRASLECEIHHGDERSAILDAMADNAEHGVRRTSGDKRKAVNRLLDDAKWSQLTQAKIAEFANVSESFVKNLMRERKANKNPPTEQHGYVTMPSVEGEISTGKDGKEYPKTKPGARGGISSVAEENEYVAAIDALPQVLAGAIRSGEIAASNEAVIALAKLPRDVHHKVGRDVRVGNAPTIQDAMRKRGLLATPKSADPKPKTDKKKPKERPGIKALTGEEAEAFDGCAQIKIWAETVGRWLSGQPSIDGYRTTYPGKEGDRVVKAATELYEALKKWGQVIK